MIPKFNFALSPEEPQLTTESKLWSTPLPSSRHLFGVSNRSVEAEQGMTYGDYFTAAQDFLEQDDFFLLCAAAGEITGAAVAPADLDHISVYLVKFGAFYHPSYVVAELLGRKILFVLNVAVSPGGRKLLAREYRNISRLSSRFSVNYWPRCYGLGQGDGGGRSIPMFLGQWFEGYHEFHITGESQDKRQVVVWDTDVGHQMLSLGQIRDCLEQAACVLAHAYNPLTFEAIGQWHLAAGDFIIALDGDKVDLKMITVRQYAPLIETPEQTVDVTAILDALVLYLIEISLKLRLDRLDGVGTMVCHGDNVIPAICRGFLRGLQKAANIHGLPDDFDITVKDYVALHDMDQLMPMLTAIVQKSGFNREERDLLAQIRDRHLSSVVGFFAELNA